MTLILFLLDVSILGTIAVMTQLKYLDPLTGLARAAFGWGLLVAFLLLSIIIVLALIKPQQNK